MFHAIGKQRPRVPRRFVYGHRRWGKVRIGERPNGNEVPVRPDISIPIQGCSTIGAEVEPNLATRIPISLEDLAGAFNPNLHFRESGTVTCQCPSSTLASLAVTHVDQYRIARRCHT